MKKIVIGTTNNNKVKRIRDMFKKEKYEFLSLEDVIKGDIGEPDETAGCPIGIAMDKASFYLDFIGDDYIVLTQDDTINFSGVKEEDNPCMHIKEPVVKKYGKFTDENAVKYYTDLASKYGGSIPMTFNYGHAVATRSNKDRTVIKIVGATSKLESRIVNKVNKLEKVPGYFLAAIMEVKVNGKWVSYTDLDNDTLIELDNDLYNSISLLLKNID